MEGNATKILGYVGIISKWFFDFPLLEKISEQLPGHEIRLVGPVDSEAQDDLDRILRRPNISYQAAVPYTELHATMQSFQIGIIPLQSIPKVWQAASSKFLQYLATGIQVVSTWMEEYDHLQDHAVLCRDHDSFLAALDRVLKEPLPAVPRERIQAYAWADLASRFRSQLVTHIEARTDS